MDQTALRARISVLEILVSDLVARRFDDEATMLRWTEGAEQIARRAVEGREQTEFTIHYQAAWDEALALVRQQFAFLQEPGRR